MTDELAQLKANIREHKAAVARYERQVADHERKMRIIAEGSRIAMAIYEAGMFVAYAKACIPERRRRWWWFR